MTTRQLRSTLTGHTEQVLSVAFSPDGKQLASTSDGGEVIIWDMLTEKELRRFPIQLRVCSNNPKPLVFAYVP